MSGILLVILVFFVLAAGLGGVAYFTYRNKLRRAKAIERGLKMVPILIHLPPPSSDTQGSNRDVREVMREKTAQAEVLYNLVAGTATEGFKSKFYGQRHIALEVIAVDGVVHFFAAVPVALVSVIEKAIQTAYPGARLEQVEDHNIFNQEGRLAATLGGEMVLRAESAYPVATYAQLERDPMEALLTTVSALEKKDGVAVQIMLRPAGTDWTKKSIQLANAKRKGRGHDLKFTAADLAKAAVMSPDQRREEERARLGGSPDVSNLQLAEIESIEEKTKHPGFEVLIRVIVSTQSVARSQQLLRDIATAFSLFEKPGLNGFKFLPALDVQGLVTAFIFRFFPAELKSNVLNSVELATLFHLPDSQFTPATSVERQMSKQVDGPIQLPTIGLLFGYNDFRGVKKEIRLSPEDRRRHTYILGQTGTGKSTMLENLAVQDMVAGNGFAFIDPHGDSAEKLLAMVPKERAEDVIYFNPADTEYPLGLNLFEFKDPTQKDFIVQETINMLYKLYDPGHTGIIGPRYEHWYRNAALTLMSDPNGSTFIEIPKVFTDTDYLKQKFKYLKDPTVIDFWTKEMGQTSDYHKSEMLGWFVSKFGAFQNNEMMRNIVGQTKSAFNIRDVMDQKKILIVNLSKGRLGELNSQLLGMIFVIKFQAAAMSRADVMEDQRPDFSLYVDEFQNFSTDSFASILSEARKYRLNLVVANQFIGQLSDEIRDAVFGNIGTIVAHRMGPDDAEFMTKQFAPVFDASDLVNIPNYNAAMRLMIGGLPSQPFSIRDLAPLSSPNLELGLAIKQLSAAKYGHAKASVEADILERFTGQLAPMTPPIAPQPLVPEPTPVAVAPVQPMVSQSLAPSPAPVMPAVTMVPAPVPAPVQPVPQVNRAATVPYSPSAPTQALPAAPPPIGASPVPVGVTPMPSTAAVVNTAGQAMSQPAGIIPEPNADAEADRLIQEGGFNPLGTPVAAPALAPAMAPVSYAPPAPVVTNIAPPIGESTLAPPPIGAPPIELPGTTPPDQTMRSTSASAPVATPQAATASSPGTLSLHDITGGRPSKASAIDPSSVPIMTPGTEPVVPVPIAVVGSADTHQQPLAPFTATVATPSPEPVIPLGSGIALETDPYANINVLGDLSPLVPMGDSQISPVPTQSAVSPVANPLPNDPYAAIDVLGAAPAPVVPAPTPVELPAPVIAAPVVPPVQSEPASPAALPVLQPVAPPPTPQLQTQTQPAANPVQAVVPMEPQPRLQEPELEPRLQPEPDPRYQPVPQPIPDPPVSLPPNPAIAPQMALPPVTPQVATESVLASEPVAETQAGEPLFHFVDPDAQSVLDRSSITDVPDDSEPSLSGLPDGVQIMKPTALPPAPAPVAIVPAPPVVATPVPVASATPVAATLADSLVATTPEQPQPVSGVTLAQSPSGVAPTGEAPLSAPVPPLAPAQTPIEPIPPVAIPQPVEPSVQLTNMAVIPLPIGAAPVKAPAGPQVAPTELPVPTESPKTDVPVPVPDLNVTLAAAVESAPAAPEPKSEQPNSEEPKAIEESGASVGLESVAQMLKETPESVKPGQVKTTESKSLKEEKLTDTKEKEPQKEPVTDTKPPKDDAPVPHFVPLIVSEAHKDNASTPRPVSLADSEPHKDNVSVSRPVSLTSTEAPKDNVLVLHPAQSESKKEPSDQAQIEKAEHEIDDLLSVSLIHSDASAMHRRLPEPIEAPRSEDDQSGIDMEMNSGPARANDAPVGSPMHMAENHHGLKVIQPLEPIVPPKELFAKELAALNQTERADAVTSYVPQPVPAVVASPAQPKTASVVPAPPPAITPKPKPSVPAPVPVPKTTPTPETTPVPKPPADSGSEHEHSEQAEVKQEQSPKPVMVTGGESGLPVAESLAAGDVAKARAERESPAAMQKAVPTLSPAPLTPAKGATKDEHVGGARRHRLHGGQNSGKPVEIIDSAEEDEHNKPTEAETQQGALTGKLIMPTGEKPKPDQIQPKTEKPKKLAVGEVYVDELGNVAIGE